MRFLLGFLVGLTLGYGLASLLTLPDEEQRRSSPGAASA